MLRILVLALVAYSQADMCPKGHKYDERTKKCYAFIHDALNFVDASRACRERFGYELISIHDEQLNLYAQQLAHVFLDKDYGSFWIGATKWGYDDWTWTDKTTFDFKNFAKEINPLKYCAHMRIADGRWIVDDCEQEVHQAMCFGPPGARPEPVTTPAPPEPCEPGWHYNPVNKYCYIFYPEYNHMDITVFYECALESSIENAQEEAFVRGILKGYDPATHSCKLPYGRHYFIGRIKGTKYEKNIEYHWTHCGKDHYFNTTDLVEGPNYVFITHEYWNYEKTVDACFFMCKRKSIYLV